MPSTSPRQTRNIDVMVSMEMSRGRGADAPAGATCEELDERAAVVVDCRAECS